MRALDIMHIGLNGVHQLLAQAEVLNANRATAERYLVRVVAMFARSIWPFYVGALSELGRFPVAATSKTTRPQPRRRPGEDELALVCDAGCRWHSAGDVSDACSRLIRYRGGDKGPVMLASGFARSATSMLTPTLHPNLVEVLLDEGYEVFAHCVVSVSLLMALLDGESGMQGKVRSAVCAQFSLLV